MGARDSRRYYMDQQVVERLGGLIDELRDILNHWEVIEDQERRERIGAVTELLADISTPAKSWRTLARINGFPLPPLRGPEGDEEDDRGEEEGKEEHAQE